MEIQTGADAGTILIVEDDKEIRQGIEIFLKGQGYRVFQAADGIETPEQKFLISINYLKIFIIIIY